MKKANTQLIPMSASHNNNIVFVEQISLLDWSRYISYCIHILCNEGSGSVRLGTKWHTFKSHDVIIITSSILVTDFMVSEDFKGETVCISESYLRKYSPENNYGIIGNFALVQNPVIPLDKEDWELCRKDYDDLRRRVLSDNHSFYEEVAGCYVRALVLDFFDFHKKFNHEYTATGTTYTLLRRFLGLLQEGAYKNHRDIEYYANELCVTSKYLSEVCRKTSGLPASYWIERFTISEIAMRLRQKNQTLSSIAYDLNFSSISYFSRFVQRLLGVSPSQYRRNFRD